MKLEGAAGKPLDTKHAASFFCKVTESVSNLLPLLENQMNAVVNDLKSKKLAGFERPVKAENAKLVFSTLMKILLYVESAVKDENQTDLLLKTIDDLELLIVIGENQGPCRGEGEKLPKTPSGEGSLL